MRISPRTGASAGESSSAGVLAPIEARQLDEQFVLYMLEVDARYKKMARSDRVRVEQWVRE